MGWMWLAVHLTSCVQYTGGQGWTLQLPLGQAWAGHPLWPLEAVDRGGGHHWYPPDKQFTWDHYGIHLSLLMFSWTEWFYLEPAEKNSAKDLNSTYQVEITTFLEGEISQNLPNEISWVFFYIFAVFTNFVAKFHVRRKKNFANISFFAKFYKEIS